MSSDERLRGVFASVFGIEASKLRDDDSVETIAEWDSVNHINLILSLEGEFGIQFEPEEIAVLTSVASIRTRLDGGIPQ